MTSYGRRVEAGIVGVCWAGRVATALVAAALFVLLLVCAALTAAVAIASAVLIEAKLWWLSPRRLAGRASGRGGGTTLEAEYEVLPSDNSGRDQRESGTPGDDRNDALRPSS